MAALTGRNILIVDDELDVLQTACEVLADAKVETARTEGAAREKLRGHSYDAVIVDIMGVNGLELLKAYGPHRGVPWIVLTAHSIGPESLLCSINGRAALLLPKDELPRLDFFVARALDEGRPLWRWLFDHLDFSRWLGHRWHPELRHAAEALADAASAHPSNVGAGEVSIRFTGQYDRAKTLAMLASSNPLVRRYAASTLCLVKDSAAQPALTACANDPDPEVRGEVRRALEALQR
jgi:CheY-like chemotaxis protein